ncbi:MAG TPA: hypothetical protein VEO95_07755, partial [Chthoniobacteraceae bacterium]|nr:hypothetical protein [Chthoniobacteraceae bacterium]
MLVLGSGFLSPLFSADNAVTQAQPAKSPEAITLEEIPKRVVEIEDKIAAQIGRMRDVVEAEAKAGRLSEPNA